MVLAERLAAHPAVELVRYPGLASHPTHATAKRVLKSYGSTISFGLGAVESTMERRVAILGQGHLPPSLLRLSVGIEDVNDLWSDLDGALRTALV